MEQMRSEKEQLQQKIDKNEELLRQSGSFEVHFVAEKDEQQRLLEQMRSEREQLEKKVYEKEQLLRDKEQLLRDTQQLLRDTQKLLESANTATGEKTVKVLNKPFEDVPTPGDIELGSGSFEENEADKLVTPQELFGIAKVIEGSWVEFALDLAPDMFQVRGNISSIQKDPNYASARVMAKAMLEIWTDEMHSEGTRRVLIQALCRNGMRKQACDVFGDEVTAIVAPQ
jgi:hypothetical protein